VIDDEACILYLKGTGFYLANVILHFLARFSYMQFMLMVDNKRSEYYT